MSTYEELHDPSFAHRNEATHPTIAVVVTSRCEVDTLGPCLAELATQCAAIGAKLIVAHAGSPPNFATLLGAERMSLTFVTAPAGTPVQELRRIGAQRTEHSVVAFVDDLDRAHVAWARQLCEGWPGRAATGGRIVPLPSAGASDVPRPPRVS